MDKETQIRQEKIGFRQSLWEFIKFALIAALIVVPVRLWIAQPFIVSGASMSPNFESGQYLVIDEFSYHFKNPQRGDVIVFRYPQDTSKFFIKRIIGLPGEEIHLNDGQIYIYNSEFPEGMQINESYLNQKTKSPDVVAVLKENEYFVMGDNRAASSDSRSWGPLPANLVIGRAWMSLWPLDKLAISF